MIDLLIAAAVGFVFGALFGVFLIALLLANDGKKGRYDDDERR